MMLRAEEFHYSCALSVGSSESELLTFIARKKLSNKLRFRYQSGRIEFIQTKISSRFCRSKTFWYTLSSKALSTSRCYAGSILRIYLSLLSYGNIVWGNTYTTRLEPKRRLQKKLRHKDHYFFKLKKNILVLSSNNYRFYLKMIQTMKPLLFCPCFDTSITIYHHLFHDLFCLNKDVHQYNTRSCSNVHEYQARTNYQLKHSIYSGKKLTLIFSTSKKTRISVYKRIYINDQSQSLLLVTQPYPFYILKINHCSKLVQGLPS